MSNKITLDQICKNRALEKGSRQHAYQTSMGQQRAQNAECSIDNTKGCNLHPLLADDGQQPVIVGPAPGHFYSEPITPQTRLGTPRSLRPQDLSLKGGSLNESLRFVPLTHPNQPSLLATRPNTSLTCLLLSNSLVKFRNSRRNKKYLT